MSCTNLGRSDIPWYGTSIAGKVFSPKMKWDGFGWTRYIGWVLCHIVSPRRQKTKTEDKTMIASLLKTWVPVRRRMFSSKGFKIVAWCLWVKSICKADDYGMVIYEMDNGGLEKYDSQVISETHLNITKER